MGLISYRAASIGKYSNECTPNHVIWLNGIHSGAVTKIVDYIYTLIYAETALEGSE